MRGRMRVTISSCTNCGRGFAANGFNQCCDCRASKRKYNATEKGRETNRKADRRRKNKVIANNRLFGRSRTRGAQLFQKLTGFQIPKGWLDARETR
jgi:hypothetical protein